MNPDELNLAIQRRNALGRRIADNRLAWLEAFRVVRLLTITAKKQSGHSYEKHMRKAALVPQICGGVDSFSEWKTTCSYSRERDA